MPKVVDSAQRRAELTEVTASEIARVGLDGITLRDIARAGGWTTGIVNHYFTDKRDLLLATFRSRADAARQAVERRLAEGATPLEAIIESALPLDEEGTLNWRVWLAFWGAAVGDDELTDAQQARHHTFHASISAALRAEQAAGRLLADLDAEHEARRLVAVLDGIAVQAVFDPEHWPPATQRRIVGEHLATLTTPEGS
jgi:AcrR family transcriptional regulator